MISSLDTSYEQKVELIGVHKIVGLKFVTPLRLVVGLVVLVDE
jgi:hypothetical protein